MKKQLWPVLLVFISLIFITPNLQGQSRKKMEKLKFSDKDFFSKDGDYLYENEDEKLPWQNTYNMLVNLKEIKQLVYSYSRIIDGGKKFSTTELTADVKVVEEEDLIDVDNIFYGYDRYNLPEDAALPPNNINLDHNYNVLYPLSEGSFRVIGQEEITTAAGKFNCTVLEAFSGVRQLQKLWMINDMSGVYARVIDKIPGDTGHYWIFELKEIRK